NLLFLGQKVTLPEIVATATQLKGGTRMQIMSSISRFLFVLALAASISQLSADTNALNVCVFSSSVQAAQSTFDPGCFDNCSRQCNQEFNSCAAGATQDQVDRVCRPANEQMRTNLPPEVHKE